MIRVILMLKDIIIIYMFHNILNIAMKDITEPIYCICLNVFAMLQSINLRTINIMIHIEIILRNSTVFHGFPEPVIFNHYTILKNSIVLFKLTWYNFEK